jgi:hypothetical protein
MATGQQMGMFYFPIKLYLQKQGQIGFCPQAIICKFQV